MAHGRRGGTSCPRTPFRYRLRRARERFGVDLDAPDTRLLITSAARLSG
ncbi:helix-turn-helix domain-containing protein [Streptomyces sp. NPDC005096]